MDLTFVKDSHVWCLAIESLRAEQADLTNQNVIRVRYDQIAKKLAMPQTQEPEKVVAEVPETIEDAIADAAVATTRRKKASKE